MRLREESHSKDERYAPVSDQLHTILPVNAYNPPLAVGGGYKPGVRNNRSDQRPGLSPLAAPVPVNAGSVLCPGQRHPDKRASREGQQLQIDPPSRMWAGKRIVSRKADIPM